jgi:hypothetical protein
MSRRVNSIEAPGGFMPRIPTADPYEKKGATEDGAIVPVSYSGQLSHRSEIAEIKDCDSDFPEPGGSPEHSGQNHTGKHKHDVKAATKKMRR